MRLAVLLGSAAALAFPVTAHPQSSPPADAWWLYSQNSTSLVWFYGCAAGLPGACQYVAVGPSAGPGSNWLLYYNPGILYTVGGTPYQLYDIWWWSNAAGTCIGTDDIVQFLPTSCVVSQVRQMTFGTEVEPLGQDPATFTRYPISFTAVTPEPGTLLLMGTGLAGLAAARRRARGRTTTLTPVRDSTTRPIVLALRTRAE